MEAVIKKIPLDINAETSQQVVFLRHMESGRCVEFILNQSGKYYKVENKSARVYVKRPNSEDIYYKDAVVTNGNVILTISTGITAEVGTVDAELHIVGDEDEVLITAPFKFKVSETIADETDDELADIPASDLNQLISAANTAVNAANASVIKDIEVSLTENGGEAAAAVEVTQDTDGQTVTLLFENLEGYDGRDGVDGVSPIVSMSRDNDRVTITVEDAETAESGVPKEMYIYDGHPGFSPTAKVTRGNKASTLTVTDKTGETKTTIYDGEQGFSPIVNVSKADGVTTLTITDADGAKTAYINDGEKGDTGAVGPAGPAGPVGPAGATGADGAYGKSMFTAIVNPNDDNLILGVKPEKINNGDRELQLGDLLLTTNGRVYKITSFGGYEGEVIADFTGVILKGEDGEAGNDGLSIYSATFWADSDETIIANSTIDTGGRIIQLNDFVLAENGRLYKVTFVYSNAVKIKYTGIEMSGGSSGADLLNEDGVIKQEHLPKGYPYSEFSEGVIWPETSYTTAEDGSAPIMGTPPEITIGKEYTVTWNGTNYTCAAIDGATIGETGTKILGNVGALTGGEDTGEPFVVVIPETDTDIAQSGVAILAVALDGTASGTISITGPIETVTIIAKNFLPEGYPYTAKGIGTILATDFAIDSDAGMGYIMEPFTVEIGQEYTVTLANDYTCIAGNGNITGDESIYAYLGNVGALTGGEDTGEPFVILIPKTESEMAQAGISAAIVTFNGLLAGHLTITGQTEIITPIAKKYLTDVVEPFVIYGEAYRHENTNLFFIRTETTFAEALRAAKNRRPVFLYVSLQDILGVDKLHIFPLVDADNERILFEAVSIDPNTVGTNGVLQSAHLTKTQAILSAQGTFSYSSTTGTLHGINFPANAIKLTAQNGKVFEVTVNDNGALRVTEVTA